MEQNTTPIDKNFILDEAMNKVNSLQSELLIKNAYIRQLKNEMAILKQPKTEEKKEETL